MIELRDSVVATADQSENLAGVRVDSDEGDLRIGDRAFALLVALADEFVDVLHAGFHGLRRGALELGIERSVDAKALVSKLLVAQARDELVVDEIDEVGGLACVDIRRRQV